MSWKDSASCRGLTHLFVPDTKGDYEDLDEIQRICNSCPVRTQCLDYSLLHNNVGYWANTDEAGRKVLKEYKIKDNMELEPIELLASIFSSVDRVSKYHTVLESILV